MFALGVLPRKPFHGFCKHYRGTSINFPYDICPQRIVCLPLKNFGRRRGGSWTNTRREGRGWALLIGEPLSNIWGICCDTASFRWIIHYHAVIKHRFVEAVWEMARCAACPTALYIKFNRRGFYNYTILTCILVFFFLLSLNSILCFRDFNVCMRVDIVLYRIYILTWAKENFFIHCLNQ